MSADTDWGTTNRVYYCEVHDSLIRQLSAQESKEPQCDWAIAAGIPREYEPCTVEMWNLTKLEGP